MKKAEKLALLKESFNFRRRFILPFKWFYQKHIWCFGYRLHCVRLFASAVWHWDACDYSGTLRMMDIAFREISKFHREHGHTMERMRTARQTLVVAELCRRLEADDYETLAGYERFDQMTEREKRQWAKHTNYLGQQDSAYLGRMFKYVRCWWD